MPRSFEVAAVVGRLVDVDGLGGGWAFEARDYYAQPTSDERLVLRVRAEWREADEPLFDDQTGRLLLPEYLVYDQPIWHIDNLPEADRRRALRAAFPVSYRHCLLEPRPCGF